ncbi:hypothetical protein [Streptomyces sp. TRM68416]|nr:hypothetical protein [Streptomyces sp. TRM68416]
MLVHALGSQVADHGAPGATDHAFDATGRPSALPCASAWTPRRAPEPKG